jgi:hypothetical protein
LAETNFPEPGICVVAGADWRGVKTHDQYERQFLSIPCSPRLSRVSLLVLNKPRLDDIEFGHGLL